MQDKFDHAPRPLIRSRHCRRQSVCRSSYSRTACRDADADRAADDPPISDRRPHVIGPARPFLICGGGVGGGELRRWRARRGSSLKAGVSPKDEKVDCVVHEAPPTQCPKMSLLCPHETFLAILGFPYAQFSAIAGDSLWPPQIKVQRRQSHGDVDSDSHLLGCCATCSA